MALVKIICLLVVFIPQNEFVVSVRDRVDDASLKIKDTLKEVNKNDDQFTVFKQSLAYREFFLAYSMKERWSSSFAYARDNISTAKSILNIEIPEILQNGAEGNVQILEEKFQQIDKFCDIAIQKSLIPDTRIDVIYDIRVHIPKILEQVILDVILIEKLGGEIIERYSLEDPDNKHVIISLVQYKILIVKNTLAGIELLLIEERGYVDFDFILNEVKIIESVKKDFQGFL